MPKLPKLLSPDEYIAHILEDLKDEEEEKEKIREAYKNALDTRKFEIELYWKRATYFWAFIAAIFIALYSVINNNSTLIFGELKSIDNKGLFIILLTIGIALLGFFFALGWFFVNRGSKVWQKNWEKHIDFLEDQINGPLFKTIIKPNLNFWNINSYFPYSVSKVNQVLSLIVLIFWILIINGILYFTLFKSISDCYNFFLFIVSNSILFSLGYWFHSQSLSFIYKDWKKGRTTRRTYIDID